MNEPIFESRIIVRFQRKKKHASLVEPYTNVLNENVRDD